MKKNIWLFVSYFICCNIFLFFTNIPFINRAKQTNWGYDNPLIHDNPLGFFNHISFIREGRDGAWSVPPLYTTEGGPRTYNWVYFILLGKFSNIFGISPFLAYTLARFVATEALFILLYLTARSILSPVFSVCASFVGLLSVPLYRIGLFDITNVHLLPDLPKAWDFFTPFVRVDMDPHHITGIVIMMCVFLLVYKEFNKHSQMIFFVSPIISFITVMIHPTTGLFFCIVLPISFCIYILFVLPKKRNIEIVQGLYVLLVSSFSALGLLIVKIQSDIGFPWSEWMNFDVKYFNAIPTFNQDFLYSGGIVSIFAIIASIVIFFHKPKFIEIVCVVWAFLPYFLLPFTNILGFAKFRLAIFGSYHPMAILCIWLLGYIITKIRLPAIRIIVVILFIGFFISSSEFLWRRYYFIVQETNFLIPTQEAYVRSFDIVKTMIPPYAHVISSDTVGMYIPAYLQLVSYIGNESFTAHYFLKYQQMKEFYSGKMTRSKAIKFLHENGIRFIFYGPNEWTYGDIFHYNLPLKTIYMGLGVSVYEVGD
jgi:hypothetical protein